MGSSSNETVAANTILNSTTATTEFINSNLIDTFTGGRSNLRNNPNIGITNSRVLVTSNNNGGQGYGIDFSVAAGPETQNGSTFIINSARGRTNSDSNSGGSASFDGIRIN